MSFTFKNHLGTVGESGGGGTAIKNQDITVTKNGTYTASTGYTGLGTVNVSLPIYYTNYDVIGTPTINTQTGVASNFSEVVPSILKTNKVIKNNPASFERQICFTTSNDVTTTQFLTSDDGYQGIVFGIEEGKFIWYASSDGGNWNVLGGVTGITNLSANTKYWVRLIFDGSTYKCYLSTTGAFLGEETTEISVNSTTKVYGGSYTYIGGQVLSGYYFAFKGSIDLSDTYIKIEGNNFWSAGLVF